MFLQYQKKFSKFKSVEYFALSLEYDVTEY